MGNLSDEQRAALRAATEALREPPPKPKWRPPPRGEIDQREFRRPLVSRITTASICAVIGWFSFPGGQVFDKGLASLTLRDIMGLAVTGICLTAAIRTVFAKWD
jgi:hypothetical protein